MNLTVIGQGYVGLTVAISAAENGHKVIGLDLNKSLVNDLLKGLSYVPSINEERLLPLIKDGAYFPTTEENSLQNSEVVIIAVPTPLDLLRNPDLSYLEAATKLIAKNVNRSALVVNESTSYPGTLRNFIKPILDKVSNQKFLLAVAPERVDPGNTEWNIKNTPRVISGLNDEATSEAIKFYSTFCSSIYKAPNPEVAEAAKLLENTFRQVNIALINEFSEIANLIGFSASEAVKAASTKPFGFMPFFPSIGVGGHCIPIDPTYLSHIAEAFGVKANFIELANQTNLLMPTKVAARIKKYLGGSLKGIRIQIAGISYKPNVKDMRESPVIQLIQELKSLGAIVSWFDPLVKSFDQENSIPLDPSVDLGLIVTPHSMIDFLVWKKSGTRVLDISTNATDYGWPKFL